MAAGYRGKKSVRSVISVLASSYFRPEFYQKRWGMGKNPFVFPQVRGIDS
jgi:hypothetical protein